MTLPANMNADTKSLWPDDPGGGKRTFGQRECRYEEWWPDQGRVPSANMNADTDKRWPNDPPVVEEGAFGQHERRYEQLVA